MAVARVARHRATRRRGRSRRRCVGLRHRARPHAGRSRVRASRGAGAEGRVRVGLRDARALRSARRRRAKRGYRLCIDFVYDWLVDAHEGVVVTRDELRAHPFSVQTWDAQSSGTRDQADGRGRAGKALDRAHRQALAAARAVARPRNDRRRHRPTPPVRRRLRYNFSIDFVAPFATGAFRTPRRVAASSRRRRLIATPAFTFSAGLHPCPRIKLSSNAPSEPFPAA